LFADQLTFGDDASRVGLVTLWTHQKRYRRLDRSLYRVMGNLYAADGVNYIARNILAHPAEVRALVVCGSDGILEDTGVRQALLNWQVTDPMIPPQEVAWLRENIAVSQCEMDDLVAHLTAENQRVAGLPPADKAPATFPFPDQTSATYPSELVGMRVLWSSIDAWIDALRHVLRFGVVAGPRKFVLNLVSVVDGDDKRLPDFVTPEQAQEYAAGFLSPERNPDVSYTYGNRMFSWGDHAGPGVNLVEVAIGKLERDPLSSRCVVDLWDNRVDSWSDEPPCLTQIIFNQVEGRLYLTGLYRSHDLYRAYFLNLYALRHLQHQVAERLGWTTGKLTAVSTHAHIYEWDLEQARATVESAGRPACRYDPRGNVAITREGGQTVLILYSPDGEPVARYEGRPRRVLQRLLEDDALSQPAHWAYVAKELLHGTE
jgi:thymidylate synthase